MNTLSTPNSHLKFKMNSSKYSLRISPDSSSTSLISVNRGSLMRWLFICTVANMILIRYSFLMVQGLKKCTLFWKVESVYTTNTWFMTSCTFPSIHTLVITRPFMTSRVIWFLEQLISSIILFLCVYISQNSWSCAVSFL